MLFLHMNRDEFRTSQKILKNLSLLSTHFSNSQLHLIQKVLLALKKERVFLVVMSSEQIYMNSRFENTNFSQRNILK